MAMRIPTNRLPGWESIHGHAVIQSPRFMAGISGHAESGPLAIAISEITGRGPWHVGERQIICRPTEAAFPTPNWMKRVNARINIRGHYKPVTWGEFAAILTECQPDNDTSHKEEEHTDESVYDHRESLRVGESF